MPEYRRYFVPGATIFFTVVTHGRRPILTSTIGRRCLREAIAVVRTRRPWTIDAFVLLPDHLHAIWSLPSGDANYSTRWRRIKQEFTVRFLAAGGVEGDRSSSRSARGERGIWQRRFWEHTITDEDELERHFDYVHYNPVKHGLVRCPCDWPYSSFHRWADRGAYDQDWGCDRRGPLRFDGLSESVGE